MNLDKIISDAGILWQHKREFKALLQFMLDENVSSVLEIGTGLGGSAYCFGEVTKHGHVVTVDFNEQGAARINPNHRRHKQPNPHFLQITGDSRNDEVERLICMGAPYDLVYFDTEHPYENCMDNFVRYGRMAVRFIAQHDIAMAEDAPQWPDAGVPRFWRELREGHQFWEFIDPDPDPRFPQWGGIGVVRV